MPVTTGKTDPHRAALGERYPRRALNMHEERIYRIFDPDQRICDGLESAIVNLGPGRPRLQPFGGTPGGAQTGIEAGRPGVVGDRHVIGRKCEKRHGKAAGTGARSLDHRLVIGGEQSVSF
jgi:hypothetical protein